MYLCENTFRVRYADTDRMGYVYYGNYAAYYETGRVEALRTIGLSYKEMEEKGIMLPVLSFQIQYFKPAFFDDLLTIKTSLTELPKGLRITFHYEIWNEKNVCLNKGETVHAFVKADGGRPIPIPHEVIDKLAPYFPK
ncbi:MAG: acyl-CoA thioesterase [Bacteroidia bacterium]